MKRQWKTLGLCGIVSLGLSACGAGTNLNQIWADDEGVDSLLVQAQVAYDAGEFGTAEELAKKVANINSLNEEAAILLGYIYLSQGGMDPFNLARKLTALSEPETTGANLADSADKANDAASTLSELGTLINLSDADYEKLGSTYEGSSGLFADGATIITPNPVNDELRESIEVLKYMSKAIKAVCRFVDNEAKSDEVDTRHLESECEQPVGMNRRQAAKAHFLWAFTHLTEALVYQSVLLFTNSSSSTSGFQTAASNLDEFSGDLGEFAEAVTDMKTATDQVFASTVDEGKEGITMIAATLENLETVEKAFSALAGLPDSISEKISSSLDKVKEVGETVEGADTEAKNLSALKGEMTKKFSGDVSEKIEAKFEELGIPDDADEDDLVEAGLNAQQIEDFQSICTAYGGLVEGVPEKDKKTPGACG